MSKLKNKLPYQIIRPISQEKWRSSSLWPDPFEHSICSNRAGLTEKVFFFFHLCLRLVFGQPDVVNCFWWESFFSLEMDGQINGLTDCLLLSLSDGKTDRRTVYQSFLFLFPTFSSSDMVDGSTDGRTVILMDGQIPGRTDCQIMIQFFFLLKWMDRLTDRRTVYLCISPWRARPTT
jgi:hypothetical protein